MTVVDIIVIVVIILSALFGVMRGLVKEAITLVKWVLAIWVAKTFSSKLAPMFPMDSEAVRQAAAFALLFVVILLIGSMISYIVTQFVKKTGLSSADRVLGFGFGFLRGFLIVTVFVVIARITPIKNLEWWQTSVLLERFQRVAVELNDYYATDSLVDVPKINIPGVGI